MIIYFVRHAEKEKEGENPDLTKRGVKQAKLLAESLSKIKFNKFYCSDLNRAKETAEIISKKIKLKPKIEKSLNEYEMGDIKKSVNKWKKEDINRLKDLYKFIDKITKNPKADEIILIVSHGITNRIIASYILDFSLSKMIKLRQYETCINVVKWSKKWKNWQLTEWNNQSHIPEKLKSKGMYI